MPRVLTILGTRPEIIRLSLVIPRLDERCTHHCLYTGQNDAPLLRDVFFTELGVRQPDTDLRIGPIGFPAQVGAIFTGVAEVIARVRPDRVVILGDTNSGLAAVLAARLGIPVYHLEAGNRSDDPRSPEEVNRRVIDHVSAVLMPYTHHSRDRLVAEGIDPKRIHVIGNPIFEVLQAFDARIGASQILRTTSVTEREYFLLTLHRAETVDVPARLRAALTAASDAAIEHGVPVIFPVHPRTRDRMTALGATGDLPGLRPIAPLGFLDFAALERHARAVLSDSGTVQEECAILGVPNVVLRDFTERPETVECGASIVAGVERAGVLAALTALLSRRVTPAPPADYLVPGVADRVAQIVIGSWPQPAG